jgi:deazaflavin-dependent oxidoreductase (nitroreductase family)
MPRWGRPATLRDTDPSCLRYPTHPPSACRCECLWPEAGTTYNAAGSARNRRRDQVASSRVTQKPDTETLKAVNNNITDEFRANAGKVGGRFDGNQLLLLTTNGAKSGEPRVAPLVVFRIDGKLLIVAGYGGADVNPAWVHNLRANPRAHVEVATDSFDVVAHELDSSEREAIIPKINATVPAFAFANYQSKTKRTIPIFELQADES